MRSGLAVRHMNYPYRTISFYGALLLLMGPLGCAELSTSFHQTDHAFRPTPARGGSPAVYMDPRDVPRVHMRSVGVITILAPAGVGSRALVRAAAAKGEELGCWAVVEHSVYLLVQGRDSSWDGEPMVMLLPVHGGGGGGGSAGGSQQSYGSVPERLPAETLFDCVIKDDVGV